MENKIPTQKNDVADFDIVCVHGLSTIDTSLILELFMY